MNCQCEIMSSPCTWIVTPIPTKVCFRAYQNFLRSTGMRNQAAGLFPSCVSSLQQKYNVVTCQGGIAIHLQLPDLGPLREIGIQVSTEQRHYKERHHSKGLMCSYPSRKLCFPSPLWSTSQGCCFSALALFYHHCPNNSGKSSTKLNKPPGRVTKLSLYSTLAE